MVYIPPWQSSRLKSEAGKAKTRIKQTLVRWLPVHTRSVGRISRPTVIHQQKVVCWHALGQRRSLVVEHNLLKKLTVVQVPADTMIRQWSAGAVHYKQCAPFHLP